MDPIKIKSFEPLYDEEVFPSFRKLNVEECLNIVSSLIQKFNLPENISSLDLIKYIAQLGDLIPNLDTEDPGFNLIKLLKSYNITQNKNIFIDWYRFDNIDEMSLDDLSKHFDDIWYPSSDDITIFDSSLNWFLFIYHYGCVSLVILS